MFNIAHSWRFFGWWILENSIVHWASLHEGGEHDIPEGRVFFGHDDDGDEEPTAIVMDAVGTIASNPPILKLFACWHYAHPLCEGRELTARFTRAVNPGLA